MAMRRVAVAVFALPKFVNSPNTTTVNMPVPNAAASTTRS